MKIFVSWRKWRRLPIYFNLLAVGLVALGNAAGQQALEYPGLTEFTFDSLGEEQFAPLPLREPAKPWRPVEAKRSGDVVEYRAPGHTGKPRWAISAHEKQFVFASNWSPDDPPEPVVLDIDPELCKATLLGLFDADGSVPLPALLHLPGRGTLRMTVEPAGAARLRYDAEGGSNRFVRVTFPGATAKTPRVRYRLEVTTVCPQIGAIAQDARYDGFRRNWLNIFQLNPRRRMLSNNAGSDTCAFCYFEYTDVARETPPLAKGLYALDMVRQTLEAILYGTKAYGMPGYGDEPATFPELSADTYPSLLIAAADYIEGRQDKAWLMANYPSLRNWADKMLATDRDGDGLIKYALSGNSGSWPVRIKFRPANWWDTIGFGHEDAYANALAYRALRGNGETAERARQADDAARYQKAAERFGKVYFCDFL